LIGQSAFGDLLEGWHGGDGATVARGIGQHVRIGDAGLMLARAPSRLRQADAWVVAEDEALLTPGSPVDELEAEASASRPGSELQPVAQAQLDGTPLALRPRGDAA